MTGDKRQTWGLIIDVLDVYERHGYQRGDHRHIGRAVSFIGEIGRIYEGKQDAPAGMHLNEPQPVPAADARDPVDAGIAGNAGTSANANSAASAASADIAASVDDDRRTILAALDEAAEYKRDRAATCADCADQSCGTCKYRLQMASTYEQVAQRLSAARQASRPAAARQPEPDTSPHQEAGPDQEAAPDRQASADPQASPDWEAGR